MGERSGQRRISTPQKLTVDVKFEAVSTRTSAVGDQTNTAQPPLVAAEDRGREALFGLVKD